MERIRAYRALQCDKRAIARDLWFDSDFVFTDDFGQHVKRQTIYKQFKKIVDNIGLPQTRFHDLRHSYAVAALYAGDNVKTVQEALGHHTAAFTLDTYGHVTDTMKAESAERMDKLFQKVSQV